MALQAGFSQAFRAPLTPESLEGTRRARQGRKKECGRNKSPFPRCHEKEGCRKVGPSERTTSCVGSGCKQADTCGRNGFQSDTWLWCHSMLLPWIVHHVFLGFPCNTEYWQLLTDEEGFLQWQKCKNVLCSSSTLPHPSHPLVLRVQLTNTQVSLISICSQNSFFPLFGSMPVVTTRRTSYRQLQLSSCGTGGMG